MYLHLGKQRIRSADHDLERERGNRGELSRSWPLYQASWRAVVQPINGYTSFFHLEDVTPFFMPPPTTAQTEHGRHLKFGTSSPQVRLFCITGAIFQTSTLG